MLLKKSDRGFEVVTHAKYTRIDEYPRLVQQSSAIGDYADSLERPGTSFLWVGEHHHLNREEVATLVNILTAWLLTGSLEPIPPQPTDTTATARLDTEGKQP